MLTLRNSCITNFNLENLVFYLIKSLLKKNGIYNLLLSYETTQDIDLSHNLLETTDGFSKFMELKTLNLSHNKIGIFSLFSKWFFNKKQTNSFNYHQL